MSDLRTARAERGRARLLLAGASLAVGTWMTTSAAARPRDDEATEQPPAQDPDWQEGHPVPAGYHVVRKRHVGVLVAGFAIFSVSYTIAAGIALSSSRWWLLVPAVGPFVEVARSPGDGGLVLDGLAQSASAVLIGYGTTSSAVLARDGYSVLVPMPMFMGKTGAGLGFIGRF